MDELTITLTLYKEGESIYGIYIGDNIGGSGITCEGIIPRLATDEATPYIIEYFNELK